MSIQKWIEKNTEPLEGKTVAITGSTGGLGREICSILAGLGAKLILIDRSIERSKALGENLGCDVEYVTVDLSDMASVKSATARLEQLKPDIFIHNAGAYSIPRKICDSGFDNVFQINFLSPYYMIRTLKPEKSVAVGSIAHNYSKADRACIDFRNRNRASLAYGNAKRYLMFSLYALDQKVSVVHPGISFTGITNHYPKLIFALIKHPMKIIFMRPRRACLSIIRGIFEDTAENEWIGPRYFDIWGNPKKRTLSTCSKAEAEFIRASADEIYNKIK